LPRTYLVLLFSVEAATAFGQTSLYGIHVQKLKRD
jgi:hypothetical protein